MRSIRFAVAILIAAVLAAPLGAAAAGSAKPTRNTVIFVADGLRYGSVTPERTPNLARLKQAGVDFTNSHSLYPTLTTVNASAIATGHYIGDTGDFANVIYTGFPVAALGGTTLPFLEDNEILDEVSAHFGGNYLNETSFVDAARKAGFATAVIGKQGPARIQALTAANDNSGTVIIDDATGNKGGYPLPPDLQKAMTEAFVTPGTPPVSVPNYTQEVYLAKLAARVVLPRLKASGKPFVLVFWSRDPDASQHGTKDSLGEVRPGINSPTAEAGVRDADTAFGMILDALATLDLDSNTNIFVTADHGFATIARQSATSVAAKPAAQKGAPGELPPGFVALDIASALKLPLYNPYKNFARIAYEKGETPSYGSAHIGGSAKHPDIIVAANGGSSLIYLPGRNARERARDVVAVLMKQDYVSGLFVNDGLGKIPGTLPMSAVGLMGSAKTLQPAIYVNFRSFSTGCPDPLMCTAEVTDSPLKTGQGMHGSFSRAETRNFMAAIGPDFKTGFADPAPVSNADIVPTMAHLAGITLPSKGALKGRVIGEAITGGEPVTATRKRVASAPGPDGLETVLDMQMVGETPYFDAAGFPGRTVGLSP